jgi:magnesium-transporting ATPase (P-type)
LLHQILNPLIFILIAAAAASVAIGETTDAVFILLVIGLNSALGAYQEYNAEKSAAGLQKYLKISARVRRSAVYGCHPGLPAPVGRAAAVAEPGHQRHPGCGPGL